MSFALQSHGVIGAFADWAGGEIAAMHAPWPLVFCALHASFFLAHYIFASQTAHVSALYTAILGLMLAAGVPPTLAALSLAFNVNLFGSLTPYASGQAVVYAQSGGYLQPQDVFVQGAVCAIASALIWGGVGMLWWKVLGWY